MVSDIILIHGFTVEDDTINLETHRDLEKK